jgi:L-rhamnose isomerase
VSAQATTKSSALIERAYAVAREQYESVGVDVERAFERLHAVPLSIPCWQGADVAGFEQSGSEIGGGLAVTGS